MSGITVEVNGLKELQEKYKQINKVSSRYMSAAAKEAIERFILPVEGIKKYPPETAANLPPTPYYIRGRGVQVSPKRNLLNSERYGTKFYIKRVPYGAIIGNSASYAPYLTGTVMQAKNMARIGWRKLIDVAKQNKVKIAEVFSAWTDTMLKDIGLK
jgi:hypothetical protein